MKKRHGRITVPFDRIEAIAEEAVRAGDVLFDVNGLRLSRRSACYLCKNGTVTVCLIWCGHGSLRVTYTVRGARP